MCSFSFSCSLLQFSFQFSALFLPADSSLFPSVSFRYFVSSDCRFFFSSFPSEKLPSSLRFLMLRLNFALTIPLSVPRRPFLLPNLSPRQSAVLTFFRPLTQELMLRFPFALALSSTARPPLISKLPAPASLPGLSPVRASLGDSFSRFLPTHLRASRPTTLFPVLRYYQNFRVTNCAISAPANCRYTHAAQPSKPFTNHPPLFGFKSPPGHIHKDSEK